MRELCFISLSILYLTISYLIYIYIYKVSLDESFALGGGHSCRGLGGLVLDHISTHQLRNGVQIAALIPRLGPEGGSSAAGRPIPAVLTANELFDRLTADSGLTSVCPALACRIPTFHRSVYLVDGHFFISWV